MSLMDEENFVNYSENSSMEGSQFGSGRVNLSQMNSFVGDSMQKAKGRGYKKKNTTTSNP